jgi:hypothetical protein
MEIYKAIPLELYNTLMNIDSKKSIVKTETVHAPSPESIVGKKGAKLWKLLENHETFSWDSKNEIKYKNQVVSGSNIVDLIIYATTNKKSVNVIGLDVFLQVLSELNIPSNLISQHVRKLIEKPKSKTWIKFTH